MRKLATIVVFLFGCSTQVESTIRPELTPAAGGHRSADVGSATESDSDPLAGPRGADGSLVDHGKVADDVRHMASGSFSPDHFGPRVFDAIVARFRAAPIVYLRVAEVRILRADRQQLSQMTFETVIVGAAELNPDEAAAVARRVLPRYRGAYTEAVSTPLPDWDGELDLLRSKIAELEAVANGDVSGHL